MVFSNKPLRFIITTLIVCLPIFGFANGTIDSTATAATKTTVVATETEAAPKAENETSEIRHTAIHATQQKRKSQTRVV